ncbi:putative transcription factor C2H2 family [Rosa chinensis]|uniref:Putative transcription factor C2H2 family n=1 Tax=Rosa chinensis TaxID=74649 RepID=A0A2P6P8V2_ROSCH|nr:putative transcription factor C2H2 family [Rosa chinensis]
MKVDERQFFRSIVYQFPGTEPLPSDHATDVVPIIFTLSNDFERFIIKHTGQPLQDLPSQEETTRIKEEVIRVSLSSLKLSSRRLEHRETLIEIVSRIYDHILEDRIRAIVDKIFEVVDDKLTVPLQPINVWGSNVNLSLYCSRPLTVPVDTIHLPFIPPPAFKTSPDFESSNLKKVKLDSLEAAEKSCVICIEDFEAGVQVVRLHCSHLYHERCIDRWLKKPSHICPICRSPILNITLGRRL